MRYAGVTGETSPRRASGKGDERVFWYVVAGGLAVALFFLMRRKPPSTNIGYLVPSAKGNSGDTSGAAPVSDPEIAAAVGTGDMLFGDAAATPSPDKPYPEHSQPPPEAPGVHFGGGAAFHPYDDAHGLLEMPGIELKSIDRMLSQSDTLP